VSFGLRPDELLAWADRHGATIIEDDDDTEVRYSGRRLEPLYTVDTTGRTIFVGSLSKTMLTTLRIGFVISPPALFVCLARGEVRDRLAHPLPTQTALARFINERLLGSCGERLWGPEETVGVVLCLDMQEALVALPIVGVRPVLEIRVGEVGIHAP
jgi:hypothetical protein